MSVSEYSATVVHNDENSLTIYDNGVIRLAGGTIVPESGTQASAIADVATGPADIEEVATALNSVLAALRGLSIIAT